ncbi:MAG TPA: hypothetical protein VIN67_04240 [Desulfobaccales bacterium]
MFPLFFWKFLGFFLLAVLLWGCGVSSQDLRQEVRDDRRGVREKMSQTEKSYEKNEYYGLSSQDPNHWNPTDWQSLMDSQGGGR